MRTCYLAGPMRGVKCLNFPLFHRVTALLRANNFRVISPAELDIEAGEAWIDQDRPDWANELYPFTPQDCKRLVKRDVETLMGLSSENNDCLFLLPGWKPSVGADAERGVARWLLLDIFELKPTETRWTAYHLHQRNNKFVSPFSFRNPND